MTDTSTQTSPRRATLDRLARAAEDLAWIVSRVPPELEQWSPGFREWNTRQILTHLVMYEQHYVVPTIRLMAAGRPADRLDVTGTEGDLQVPARDLVALDARTLHARLRAVEAERDRIAAAMSDEEFVIPRPSVWRRQSPQWVLEKSFGHTWEHGVTIFYITHFASLWGIR